MVAELRSAAGADDGRTAATGGAAAAGAKACAGAGASVEGAAATGLAMVDDEDEAGNTAATPLRPLVIDALGGAGFLVLLLFVIPAVAPESVDPALLAAVLIAAALPLAVGGVEADLLLAMKGDDEDGAAMFVAVAVV